MSVEVMARPARVVPGKPVAARLPGFLPAALSYAARGWKVFPIAPGQKAPPLTTHGFLDATTDPATILRWWTDHPDANIGIATGRGSRLLVVDLDLYKKPEALRIFQAQHGPARTYTVKTPRGGLHLYFLLGPRQEARCRAEVDGICIKGDGGFVVAPPSITADGEYRGADARRPARAPETLLSQPGTTKPRASSLTASPTPESRASYCSERTASDGSDGSKQSFSSVVLSHVAGFPHSNNQALFNLVRSLKGWELSHGPLSPADKLEAFNAWFLESGNRGVLRNELSRDAYLSEYLRAWSRAKFALGCGSILPILERAKVEPLPSEAGFVEGSQKKLLVALCYQLHCAAGGGKWFLSGSMGAALLFGKENRAAKQTTVSLWLRELHGLGILEIVEQNTTVRARRYRYLEQEPVIQGTLKTE